MMMCAFRAVILVTGCFQAGASVEGRDPSVTDLVQFWEARDAALLTARISFKAEAKSTLRPTLIASRWTGVWSMNGPIESVQWTREEPQEGKPLAPVVRCHATWDGSQLRNSTFYMTSNRWSEEISTHQGGAFMAWMPLVFGITSPSNSSGWPVVFAKGGARVLGREPANGRNCLKLRLVVEIEGGEPVFVTDLWVDTDLTLLVWKQVLYGRQPEGSTVEGALEINKVRFTPLEEYSALDARKIGDFWIPCKGLFRFLDNPSIDEIHVTMGEDCFDINAPPVAKDFVLPKEPGMLIYDTVRDMTFYVNGQKGTMSTEEQMLERTLLEVAQRERLTPAPHPGVPQPILRASCGPNALYFWFRLHGFEVSLDEILATCGDAKATSLEDLSAGAARIARPMVAMQIREKSAGCPEGFFIAHLKGIPKHASDGHPDDHGHYVVARQYDKDFQVISPPGKAQSISKKDFYNMWSGYVLVPPEAVEQINAGMRLKVLRTIYGIAGGSLFCAGLFLVFRRVLRRAKGKTTSAMATTALLALAALGAGGCSRAPIKPLPLLQATTPLTYQFADVREGKSITTEFAFRNTTAEPLNLGIAKSCGCTEAILDKTTLAPGAEAKIAVRINTAGKGGGFNQFVEVLGKGKSLLTFWVVGRVIPGLRFTPDPLELNLGMLRVGQEFTRKVTVEAICSNESPPVKLKLMEAPKDSPFESRAEWTAKEVSEIDFKRKTRRYYECLVHIRATREERGQLGVLIFDNVADSSHQGCVVMVRGDIVGSIDISPRTLFLGDIRLDQSVRKTVKAKVDGKPEMTPSVISLAKWIHVQKCSNTNGETVIDLECNGYPSPGLVAGDLEISIPDKPSVRVRVVGMVR